MKVNNQIAMEFIIIPFNLHLTMLFKSFIGYHIYDYHYFEVKKGMILKAFSHAMVIFKGYL